MANIRNGRDENKYVNALAKVMRCDNGNPAGYNAIAESLKRGLNPANDAMNKKCLPEPSKLTNEFKTKAA